MKTLEEYKNYYFEKRKILKAYHYLASIVEWDSETVAPIGATEARGDALATISELAYKIDTDEEMVETINYLYEHKDELDEVLRKEISDAKESNDKSLKIPMEEVIEASKLFNDAFPAWQKAKQSSDFSIFEPYLEKIVAYQRRYVKYVETEELKGYDVLLDEFEKGMNQEKYDEFFDLLKKELVPFIKKVLEKGNHFNEDFNKLVYKKEDQIKVSEHFRDVMCFDRERGIMMESEHPFTNGISLDDVRITNHYYEDNFVSSIFSAIHETGHALYEANVDRSLKDTMLCGGASCAMHESQSRFYENIVARSEGFLKASYPYLQEAFGDNLKNVEFDNFYKFVNKVEASYIRTDADELTYPIHVMLRYDLEKKLMAGELEVKDLEKEWNRLFKEYFGIEVKCAKEGVLQDVHWAGGSFGYFPTYALGSAYGAQFLHYMKQELDFDKEVGKDNISAINEWLKNKIHKYGASKYPADIIKIVCKEDFNPKYYIEYLKDKYSKIYDL